MHHLTHAVASRVPHRLVPWHCQPHRPHSQCSLPNPPWLCPAGAPLRASAAAALSPSNILSPDIHRAASLISRRSQPLMEAFPDRSTQRHNTPPYPALSPSLLQSTQPLQTSIRFESCLLGDSSHWGVTVMKTGNFICFVHTHIHSTQNGA